MYKRVGFISIVLLAAATSGLHVWARSSTADAARQEAIAKQIIAREKAWAEAWQRKDRAFLTDYFADDMTGYLPSNPYLLTNPRENFDPKFDKIMEQYKILDWEMYNPQVQIYGEVAILTYNNAVTGEFGGQRRSYTGKATAVFVKRGTSWRLVHGHESANPVPQG